MPAVLVVDDDPHIQVMLREVLEEEGYDVWVVGNGQEALDLLDRLRPDVILLDLMMPVMDGREFYECFVARYGGAATRIPVLLISAGHGLPDRARSMGTDGFLPKPFDLNALLDEVARFTSANGNAA